MEEKRKKFEKAYDEYNAKIYRFVFLKVSTREIAEDLAAEVFLRAWEAFQREEIKNIQAYLYQIARNVVADHYGGKKLNMVSLEKTAMLLDSQDPVEKSASTSLEMDRVRQALFDIHGDYQDLIIWRYLDELSIPEIAQITGKSEDSVRVGIHRALEALKERLGV